MGKRGGAAASFGGGAKFEREGEWDGLEEGSSGRHWKIVTFSNGFWSELPRGVEDDEQISVSENQ
jgi:hypothetical protein